MKKVARLTVANARERNSESGTSGFGRRAISTGKATLPAGEYVVKCLDLNRKHLVFQSSDGKATAIVSMILVNGRSQEDARLVFRRYGRRYFFFQAWAGGSSGSELPTTHAERSAARELAGIKPQRETIAATTSQ